MIAANAVIDVKHSQKSKKIIAYEAMEAMKKFSPFPKDYDYEAVIKEALAEKYGYFN